MTLYITQNGWLMSRLPDGKVEAVLRLGSHIDLAAYLM